MGNFRGDRSGGGRRDFGGGGRGFGGGGRGFGGGGGRGFGRNAGGRPEMHQTICSECGQECEVPFRPSGDKPVYCSDCFKNKGGKTGRPERKEFKESRSFDRPDFDNSRKPDNKKLDQLIEKFEALNHKLDKILETLNPRVPAKEAKKETKKEVKIEKISPKSKKAVKKTKK